MQYKNLIILSMFFFLFGFGEMEAQYSNTECKEEFLKNPEQYLTSKK